VVATSDGGFVIAGEYRSDVTSSQTYSELWLFKIDGNGGLVWQRAYSGPGKGDIGYSVYQTSDRGLVVAGYTTSYGAAFSAVWVLRLDSTGNILWQKAYGGGGVTVFDEAYSVVQLSDGSFVVSGSSSSAAVLRLDSSGNVIWGRTYGSSQFWQALPSSDGGILLVGGAIQGAMVLKLDPSSIIGPDCSIEGSFNSTTVGSTAIPVSTDDTSFTTTAKVYTVNALVTDTSATIAVPCSSWLVTIATTIDPSTIRALNKAILHVHASSENQAVSGANVTLGSNGPGNFSRSTGLTDSGGNFTLQYGAPDVSTATTVKINVTIFKWGYATSQKLVELIVNPALGAPSVPPPLILWPYLPIVAIAVAALAPAAYFLASRNKTRNHRDMGAPIGKRPRTTSTVME
jgi:hypothetical protein